MKTQLNSANKIILAIDTSCDDTSVALVVSKVGELKAKVLSNVVASQVDLHKQYGGVFPTVAKQAHRENIGPSVDLAMKRAGIDWDEISAIAVTVGPGLAPALEVGINQARELSLQYDKPLIAVNHIEGHALSVLAERVSRSGGKSEKILEAGQKSQKQNVVQNSQIEDKIQFPVLSLVVSGGHTDLILVREIGDYVRVGFSIDDAAGECLDKIGRMLGLGYPAGPVIERLAEDGDAERFKFPLPMTASGDFNLSFSGLKTFARNKISQLEADEKLDRQAVMDFCASAQKGVVRHIIYKVEKFLSGEVGGENSKLDEIEGSELGSKVKEIWLGGGVAANLELRKALREVARKRNLKFRVPYDKKLCADNAAMIGVVAGFKLERGEVVSDVAGMDRKPRWRIEQKY